MDGQVTILMAFRGKSCAQKIVNVTHEIHFNMLFQFLLEQGFSCGIFRVENKIINVNSVGLLSAERLPEKRHGWWNDCLRPKVSKALQNMLYQ
jgi:hypothetical protein